VFLDRDAFTLNYQPSLVDIDQIIQVIIDLGYQPEVITDELKPSRSSPVTQGPVPEFLTETLSRAKRQGKLVFIDFYAEWCGPCILMETMTLSDSGVKLALEAYVFLKLDTDIHPEVATHYNIVGMPTLIVVDESGNEVWRHIGSIDTDELVAQLSNL